jgi:hypothetical protein
MNLDDDAKDWEYRVSLSHADQVKGFGYCICEGTEGHGQLSHDCPVLDEDIGAENCQICLYAREYCDCEEYLPAQ